MGRMNKTYYRYVEHELYNFQSNLLELKETEKEIIETSPSPDGERVQSSGTADTTYTKAVKLMTTTRLITLRRNTKAIETSIKILQSSNDQRKYQLLEMKYLRPEYTDRSIADKLCISIETYYRWKRQCVELVALHMGLT